MNRKSSYYFLVKRLIDIVASLAAITVFLPIILVTAVGLAAANRGTPFFFQERPGKDERTFRIIKFKTMNDRKDAEGRLLPDAERLTRTGSVVRKVSLDELPQLINVLKGDMSLIGPRPLRTYYLPIYSEEQRRRHHVRPGITGWAQVNGRNAISWTRKFELDVWYVDNISLMFDIRILLLTVGKVVSGSGVNASENLTMERFNGYN